MIHNYKGQAELECDNCGDTHGPGDFQMIWSDAKAEGWKAVPFGPSSNKVWNHYCPKCAPHINKTPNLDDVTKRLLK